MSLPITLLIDDPAPLINLLWWHFAESQGTDDPRQGSGEPVAKEVPMDFLREFVDVVAEHGIKGKFSVLPYPAGLGKISEGWEGCDRKELAEWIEIVRRGVTPLMDITPEILTHGKAVNLENMSLYPENERNWAQHQTEATLTPYIAASLRFLNEVGLEANGVTSPWDFGREVEEDYRLAIRKAMKEVNGRDQTWFFLHVRDGEREFLSETVHREGDAWLVSLCSQVGDYLWETMETMDSSDDYVSSIADKYLTEDGASGAFPKLFEVGTPIVFHSHWQSLYANGRRTGLRVLREVGRRVNSAWGDDVEWLKCSEMAEMIVDGEA